jgi:hypothetical protein
VSVSISGEGCLRLGAIKEMTTSGMKLDCAPTLELDE